MTAPSALPGLDAIRDLCTDLGEDEHFGIRVSRARALVAAVEVLAEVVVERTLPSGRCQDCGTGRRAQPAVGCSTCRARAALDRFRRTRDVTADEVEGAQRYERTTDGALDRLDGGASAERSDADLLARWTVHYETVPHDHCRDTEHCDCGGDCPPCPLTEIEVQRLISLREIDDVTGRHICPDCDGEQRVDCSGADDAVVRAAGLASAHLGDEVWGGDDEPAPFEERLRRERERRLAAAPWHYWKAAGRPDRPLEERYCDHCAGWFGVPHDNQHREGVCRSAGTGQCACIDCWVYEGRTEAVRS